MTRRLTGTNAMANTTNNPAVATSDRTQQVTAAAATKRRRWRIRFAVWGTVALLWLLTNTAITLMGWRAQASLLEKSKLQRNTVVWTNDPGKVEHLRASPGYHVVDTDAGTTAAYVVSGEQAQYFMSLRFNGGAIDFKGTFAGAVVRTTALGERRLVVYWIARPPYKHVSAASFGESWFSTWPFRSSKHPAAGPWGIKAVRMVPSSSIANDSRSVTYYCGHPDPNDAAAIILPAEFDGRPDAVRLHLRDNGFVGIDEPHMGRSPDP